MAGNIHNLAAALAVAALLAGCAPRAAQRLPRSIWTGENSAWMVE
jgi:ABC-type uncharacterized transport system auxiliary subunit